MAIPANAAASMSFPVINMEKLETEERGAAMGAIGDACENWGFFELLNHGISHELMDEVERVSKAHYAACREEQFKEFAVKTLEAGEKGADVKGVDWESTFFVRHLPASNLADLPDLDHHYSSAHLRSWAGHFGGERKSTRCSVCRCGSWRGGQAAVDSPSCDK
ncbi:hypothetical protein ACQJBY_057848 [Aegilops geniculata]